MKRFGGDSGTILIVDDEQKNIQVVGTMLAAFGYDFMVARSGEQALDRVRAKTPDLVLLDLYMDGMNGFDVCREFANIEEMEEIPVIFLSADDDKNTIVKALESGGVDYVTKPFNKAELLARVRAHLELKHTRDECSGLLDKTEQFLEVMAHDLKNWIGSASFCAQMLETMDDLPERAGKAVSNISESTGKAIAFINEFLANARATKTDFEIELRPFDLVMVARSIVTSYEPTARAKKIHLDFESGSESISVTSDRGAVERIIENLVSNAVKFAPPGGNVIVRIEADPVALFVKDDGPGFSEEDRKKLFEPYTRLSAKPTAGEVSTGLGLSIVKNLAEKIGAKLEVGEQESGAEISLRFSGKVL